LQLRIFIKSLPEISGFGSCLPVGRRVCKTGDENNVIETAIIMPVAEK